MLKSKTQIVRLFSETNPFVFDSGHSLPTVNVAYETYGRLNTAGDNAILICHALTGDAHAAGFTELSDEILQKIPFYAHKKPQQPGWWDGLIGPGKALDTDRYFVVCPNILGSCYGTTGPSSAQSRTGKAFGPKFPPVTVRDMVRVQKALIDYLGIKRLTAVIGGSLGGMMTLEWGILFPELARSIIPIAAPAAHSAWAIGFNHLARQAITTDPAWNNGYYTKQPEKGLSLARQIAMISYRTHPSFQQRFGRLLQDEARDDFFRVESYLSYQGNKLVKRFDANSMITLTKAMDGHDVGKGRGGVEAALHSIKAKTLSIGIDSDLLYPVNEQKEIAKMVPQGTYREIRSVNGHDAFLIEYDQLNPMIKEFLNGID